ncbi:DUF934 domain-containing protein [Tropicimonas sp. IMCC34011]|uniref:DUF934 domain-containing protein n=1 Tax=Tropicimonas sp. IMCC34011 TaxID=2248759 RepID=UPI000E252D05|nr:DUF934 domain-containing protein [Tropicimonas sp. IMCC34011]
MSNIIVTDRGFGDDDFTGAFADPEAGDVSHAAGDALALGPETDPASLSGKLDGVTMIRVAFPSFSDGRGFSIARALRRMGYEGRLRAYGHVIADQYAMARRCGFDEVEIAPELAARQPQEQWLARAKNWRQNDYRARLAG